MNKDGILKKNLKKEFEESSQYYNPQKQAIYETNASDPTLSDAEINELLTNLFLEFVER